MEKVKARLRMAEEIQEKEGIGNHERRDGGLSRSGNVFADLGLPDAEERLAKAELARQILNIITECHLTQTQTADLLGID